MFRQAWKKYLPVITILLKRAAVADQTLGISHSDFERAAAGRKMKWSFPPLLLNNGRIQNNGTKYPLHALDLAAELLLDEQIIKILQKQEFEFSMSSNFSLQIKRTPALIAVDVLPQTGE